MRLLEQFFDGIKHIIGTIDVFITLFPSKFASHNQRIRPAEDAGGSRSNGGLGHGTEYLKIYLAIYVGL